MAVNPRSGGFLDRAVLRVPPRSTPTPGPRRARDADPRRDPLAPNRMFDQDRRAAGESNATLDRWEIDLTAGSVHTRTRRPGRSGIPADQRGAHGHAAPVRLPWASTAGSAAAGPRTAVYKARLQHRCGAQRCRTGCGSARWSRRRPRIPGRGRRSPVSDMGWTARRTAASC